MPDLPGRLTHHLREQEGTIHPAGTVVATQRSAGIELPIPQSEDQDIGNPQGDRGTQQGLRRVAVLGNADKHENQRTNQAKGDRAVRKESQVAGDVEPPEAARNYDGDQQDDHNHRETPTGAQ